MFWDWVERVSWVAGIISAVIALIASLMASRSAALATRQMAMLVAAATDKPELLQTLELEARERSEAVQRRVRAVVVSTLTMIASLGAIALAAVMLANLPDHVSTRVVGGDAPRTVQECAGSGEATVCAPVHVYELAAGAQVKTRFGGLGRTPARTGHGGLSVELHGCESEVRWHVELDGRTVAEAVSRDVLVNTEFPTTSDREYTFVAERAGGDCATTELRVRTGFTFSG
ncbi:hypothetical protein [Lentzea albidocapillata]|uniref:Uncharacterized protein n=1 Tax=Lentzea albidocapillata TaxID=40571 RepID=A0A1W2CBH9_9PSEU|nr:hypothetical protein [Lentzea albidocapillata]SMC82519.1 hypothetical protein SAMN05660733_01880 [Lentzea albidocapillata]